MECGDATWEQGAESMAWSGRGMSGQAAGPLRSQADTVHHAEGEGQGGNAPL